MNLSYLIYRSKYHFSKYLNLKKPVDVSLELASHCNQRCGYCYHADQDNLPFAKNFMNTFIAFKIIKESARLGVNSLKFNYRGESTLHPDFYSITTFAKNLAGGSTFIDRITNSNFKFSNSKDEIFQGLCNQTKVKISFDSFIKEVMESQRAGSIHELALKNIDTFYNHRSRKNTEIVIQAVRTLKNKDEDIEHEAKKRWPEASISIRDMVAGRVDTDLSSLEHRKRDSSERQSCTQAHARLIFHHDGRAGVCCPDIKGELIVGDIKENTVKEIFNSQNAIQLRKDLKSGKAFNSDPCKSCSSFETYKGFKPKWES